MKFKNILLYAALLSGMSFSSCTDFLDEDSNPNALSPSIFWKSEGDIMKGMLGHLKILILIFHVPCLVILIRTLVLLLVL